MLDTLIEMDKHLLLALNGSNSLMLDNWMWALSRTWVWLPLLGTLLYVFVRNARPLHLVLLVLGVALAILMADQFASSFCKPFFCRLRPTHDPSLQGMVKLVYGYTSGQYGFISSHAANTFAVATFLALVFRHAFTSVSMYLWAMLVSYSRIYLGVHFPGDILCGALSGVAFGIIVYLLYLWVKKHMRSTGSFYSSAYTSSGFLLTDLAVFRFMLCLSVLFTLFVALYQIGFK